MSRLTERTHAWEWAGLAAMLLIALALPAYYLLDPGGADRPADTTSPARFIGSEQCRDCHNPEFDAWRGDYSNPFRDLQDDGRSRNWDNERRVNDQNAEGVVAEVIFPNTVPPFYKKSIVTAQPPTPDHYDKALAGIRAHNRWLVDFCAEDPDRRAGPCG